MYASQGAGPSGKAARILGTAEDFSGVLPTPKTPFKSFTNLLEPALDGPPSPERLRQLSQDVRRGSHAEARRGSHADIRHNSQAEMRRGSHADIRRGSHAEKHLSQQTTSSGSSLLSASSDRPSWENSMEQLTLTRKSSNRSSTSSVPSRERPDSLQIFGKSLFNRKGKFRRESSDQGSSHNSLQSNEVETSKEAQPFLSTVLSRRKGKGDIEAAARKIQISGPYNFQHVTHSQNENIGQQDSMTNPSDLRYARRPTDPFLHGIRTEGLHANYSSESLGVPQDDPYAGLHSRKNSDVQARPLNSRERAQSRQNRYSPPVPIPPLVKRAQSDEQMRVPPPRPPRSPIGQSFNWPAPPPRLSSRRPSRDEVDPLERPMTNSSSRQPPPFVLSPVPPLPEPPATAQGLLSGFSQTDIIEQQIVSHAISTPDNVAWPLTANVMMTLPDVPEEEEVCATARQERFSTTSNQSSLRGSVSAPLLRQKSQAQVLGQRPPSNSSETLGKMELLTAQRLLQASIDGKEGVHEDNLRYNWEDDIDYCYEHAAESDFDYAWERPSCDVERENDEAQSPKTAMPVSSQNSAGPSPNLQFLRNVFDVPALSPASQTSLVSSQGVITPTLQQGPVTSNFSLPRRDSSTLMSRGHSRTTSRVSAMSPSLLIPNDFHDEMLFHERGDLREEDEDDGAMFLSHGTAFLDPSDFKKSNPRASSSTINSVLSDQSASSSRHKSTTSNSTAHTRWTASSAATSIESWQAPGDDSDNTVSKLENDEVNPLPVLDDVPKHDTSGERHIRAQSRAEVLPVNAGTDGVAVDGHSPTTTTVPFKARHRARTISRSHNPPQFGLFPTGPASYTNMPGGRI